MFTNMGLNPNNLQEQSVIHSSKMNQWLEYWLWMCYDVNEKLNYWIVKEYIDSYFLSIS